MGSVHSKLAATSSEELLIKYLRGRYLVVLRSEFRGVSVIFCGDTLTLETRARGTSEKELRKVKQNAAVAAETSGVE